MNYFIANAQATILYNKFGNATINITAISPRDQSVNWILLKQFPQRKSQTSIGLIENLDSYI